MEEIQKLRNLEIFISRKLTIVLTEINVLLIYNLRCVPNTLRHKLHNINFQLKIFVRSKLYSLILRQKLCMHHRHSRARFISCPFHHLSFTDHKNMASEYTEIPLPVIQGYAILLTPETCSKTLRIYEMWGYHGLLGCDKKLWLPPSSSSILNQEVSAKRRRQPTTASLARRQIQNARFMFFPRDGHVRNSVNIHTNWIKTTGCFCNARWGNRHSLNPVLDQMTTRGSQNLSWP
jgi:hypothetical protein